MERRRRLCAEDRETRKKGCAYEGERVKTIYKTADATWFPVGAPDIVEACRGPKTGTVQAYSGGVKYLVGSVQHGGSLQQGSQYIRTIREIRSAAAGRACSWYAAPPSPGTGCRQVFTACS